MNFRKRAAGALGLAMLLQSQPVPLLAEEQSASLASLPSAVHDFWDFEDGHGAQSSQGEQTEGTLHGVTIADSGSDVFGKVLHFPSGADKYMLLDSYLNTGSGSHAFSMWYRYNSELETESEADSSTVLLQHEGSGKSVLTLRSNGQYHTYLNGSDVLSNDSVSKGGWQHITISFDQDTKKVRFYINGELDSEKDLGTGSVSEQLALRLGAHKNAGNMNPHPMHGDIDEFYVFDQAISEEEALAIYAQKGTAVSKASLEENIAAARTLAGTLEECSEKTDLETVITQASALLANSDVSLEDVQQMAQTLQAALEAARNALPLELSISDEVIRTIEPDSIFGINHRYAFNAYGTFDDSTMKVRDEFKTLYKQAGFGSIRYPGGSISNLFNWKTTLGPLEQRKKQVHAFYNNGSQKGIDPNFGLEEIADFADEVDSEIVYVYSMARGNAQDASDLIEFLNAQVGTNPNGGTDWAAVRAAYGHPEPYNVRFFEIGNEIQQAYGINNDGTTTQAYWIDYRTEGTAVNAFVNGSNTQFTQRYCANPDNWDKTASRSDGSANLVRQMRHVNTNPMLFVDGKLVNDPDFQALDEGARVYVGTDGSLEEWTVAESLENAGADDKVCVVDYSTGEIHFGDGVHGKIPASGLNIYATYSVPHEGFNAVSQAMRDTQQAINEAENRDGSVQIYTAWESADFINLENQLGKADLYDGMTIHPYSGTVLESSHEAYYLDAMARANRCKSHVESYVSRMPGKLPVISEFGIYYNTSGQTRSQTHALYVARCMMDYAALGSPYIQKHCLSDYYTSGADALGPTQQAVIQVVPLAGADTSTGKGNFGYFATPSARIFEMFNSGFGTELLETSLDTTPTLSNSVESLPVLASRDETGNYSIAIENLDLSSDRQVKISLPEGESLEGKTLSIQRLDSETITDENSLSEPDKVKVTKEELSLNAQDELVVNVHKHSFAIMRIYEPSDKERLSALIEQAESLELSDYVSTTDLSNRLSQAKSVSANEHARQALVDKKVEQLEYAISHLERLIPLNTSLLQILIEDVDAAYDADSFAPSSALEAALDEAKDILENPLSQIEISEMTIRLHRLWLNARLLPYGSRLADLQSLHN